MVEVFKTDVINPETAWKILEEIRETFPGLDGNFDLQDCDHILRVTSKSIAICPKCIIKLLAAHGHQAEVLEDEFESINAALEMP